MFEFGAAWGRRVVRRCAYFEQNRASFGQKGLSAVSSFNAGVPGGLELRWAERLGFQESRAAELARAQPWGFGVV